MKLVVINFKTYETSLGKNALALAKACEAASKKMKIPVVIAVNALDLAAIAKAVSIPVYAQHVDGITYGAHTGHIVPESVKKLGASGTLLNHAERQLPAEFLEPAVQRAHEAKLRTIVCATTPQEIQRIAQYKPTLLAIEPPELIGGNVSISSAKPEIITRTTHMTDIPVLCGAGVHTADDVRKALALGASGILVAHAVTGAKDPKKALLELLEGFR